MAHVAGIVVVASGLYLLALALIAILRPALAGRFLLAFASSARAHYLEQALRLIVGTAIVVYCAQVRAPAIMLGFGWILIVTSLGLLCVPWRWHRSFARQVVPPLLRHIRPFALVAGLAGLLLMAGVFLPLAGRAA